MPVPTHREDCVTKIWPTTCPECGEDVYFFSCTCGSKVYFDLPHPPWNPHENRCIPYLIRYLTEEEHISGLRVRQIVEEYSRTSGIPIPPDIHRRLVALENKGKTGIVINKVAPTNKECDIVGKIIEVKWQVNFIKRLRYSDNAIGRGLLGKLVKDSYVEVTIREDPDEETRYCNQYEFFVPLKIFEQSGLKQGARAFAVLNPHIVPGGQCIWLANTIEEE
jgi:hypothetical protein